MDARDWDERYAGSELVWSAEPNRFVARECADLPPGRAVDLGAGEGRNALWLAGRGWRVTAVDFSAVALDKGRRLAAALAGADGDAAGTRGSVTWLCADVTTWRPDRDETGYDLAVLAYLQLPADQRRAAVRAGFDALHPGGTLLLVAHDTSNMLEGTGGPQDPAVLMTAADVLGDLAGRPFDVVRAGRVERVVEDDGHGTEGHGSDGDVTDQPTDLPTDQHDGHATGQRRDRRSRTAYDCLVRVTRH